MAVITFDKWGREGRGGVMWETKCCHANPGNKDRARAVGKQTFHLKMGNGPQRRQRLHKDSSLPAIRDVQGVS